MRKCLFAIILPGAAYCGEAYSFDFLEKARDALQEAGAEGRNFRLDKTSRPGVQMAVVANDYGPDFPVAASRKAYLDSALREKESGKIESWMELVSSLRW